MNLSTLLAGARLVLPGGVVTGSLEVTGELISRIVAGDGSPAGGHWIVPGFVDIHVHGGAGGSFPSGDPDDCRKALALHRAHGTTTMLASLVTAPLDSLHRAAAVLAEMADDGLIAGIHLEGPFLAEARCGAQDPRSLRSPDRTELRELLRAGRGHVRMVTIAPELPGALDLVRDTVAAGALAAAGHTDAGYEQTRAGIAAGATVATHLCNGMRGLHHREPGPIGALVEDPRVTIELINDGVHLHPAVVRMLIGSAGPARTALVTDAMAATGLGDGTFRLGPMEVVVRDGTATLAGGSSLAGSTLTMDAAFRHAVRELGLPMERAAEATSLAAARVLGLDDRIGSLAEGKAADLVVLDQELRVTGVMARGAWVVRE